MDQILNLTIVWPQVWYADEMVQEQTSIMLLDAVYGVYKLMF